MPGWPHCLCKQEGQRGPELHTERTCELTLQEEKITTRASRAHFLNFFYHFLSGYDENCVLSLELKVVVENLTEEYL